MNNTLNNRLREHRDMEIADEQSRGNAQRETRIDIEKKIEIFNILDYISPTPLPQDHDVLQRDFQPPQSIHHLLPPSISFCWKTPIAYQEHQIFDVLRKPRPLRNSTDIFPFLIANEPTPRGGRRLFDVVNRSNGGRSHYIETREAKNGDPLYLTSPNPRFVEYFAFKGTHWNVIPNGWFLYEITTTNPSPSQPGFLLNDHYILTSQEAKERWWSWVYDNIGNNNIALDVENRPRVKDVGIYSYTSDTGSSFNRTHFHHIGDTNKGIAMRQKNSLNSLEADIKKAIKWYNSKYGKNISIPPLIVKGKVIKKRPIIFSDLPEYVNYVQSLYESLPEGTMGVYYRDELDKKREDSKQQKKQARKLFKGEKMKEHLKAVLEQIDKKEEERKWKLSILRNFDKKRKRKRSDASSSKKVKKGGKTRKKKRRKKGKRSKKKTRTKKRKRRKKTRKRK